LFIDVFCRAWSAGRRLLRAIAGQVEVSRLGGGRKQSAAPASDELRARTATELTQREREILSLLTEGGRNKAIARRLDITEGTVKVPMKGILG